VAHELGCWVEDLDEMSSEEFNGWYFYLKLIKEESQKPPKGKGGNTKSNTTYY